MKTLHTLVAFALAGAGMLAIGCEHTDGGVAVSIPPPQPVGVTNVQPHSIDAFTVDRLASARCDREQSCDNVGEGKKYVSRHVCMEQLRGHIDNDLNAYQCPGGIDETAVTHCVSAIGAEECGAHPVEALTRIDKCRAGAMCLK
jgi:hypothetical protein